MSKNLFNSCWARKERGVNLCNAKLHYLAKKLNPSLPAGKKLTVAQLQEKVNADDMLKNLMSDGE
ncbi:hypothetical protein AX16_000759 [Volvariella volvacea WC 439]|nr:hypothetical protein AX16_000759 [Volvariella volvacea WC 439]